MKSAAIPALIRIMNRQKEIVRIVAQLDDSGEHNAELHKPLAELTDDALARVMAFQPNDARRKSSQLGSSTIHVASGVNAVPTVPPHNLRPLNERRSVSTKPA